MIKTGTVIALLLGLGFGVFVGTSYYYQSQAYKAGRIGSEDSSEPVVRFTDEENGNICYVTHSLTYWKAPAISCVPIHKP